MATILRAAETGWRYARKSDLYVMECSECGILWGVPNDYDDRRRNDGQTFYCPNGHGQCYRDTEEKRLRRELEAERRRSTHLVSQLDQETAALLHERNSARALKGHLTRMRRRVANGVCPVPGCKRSGFVKVMQHIVTKHPEWHAEHVHEIASG